MADRVPTYPAPVLPKKLGKLNDLSPQRGQIELLDRHTVLQAPEREFHPRTPNRQRWPGAPNGGMTIYYTRPRPPAKDLSITIFPEGFRMRVGAPNARRMPYTAGTASINLTTFQCWDGTGIGPGTPGVGALDSFEFPVHQCKGGIRSQVYFPQCWDGKNLDSDNHGSHVAWPGNWEDRSTGGRERDVREG